MVTNTAGTTAEVLTTKENGDCKKEDEITNENKNLKQNSSDSLKSNQIDKASGSQQNDSNKTNIQAENSEDTNFFRTSDANVMTENNSYNSRVFGNGLPTAPSTNMEGPHQANPNVSYSNYSSMNNGSPAYSGPRLMQTGSNFSSMQQRYPTNQQPATTPTLNQLLTTPSRHPSQYPNYGNQPNQKLQPEYGQGHQQPWPAKTQQLDRLAAEQTKSDPNNFPPQQQYPAAQQHANYPPQYARYPSPAGGQPPYSHPHQQAPYNNMMLAAGQSGYPPSNTPARHPNYPGYPNYSQQSSYYAQRPPGNYTASNSNQSTPTDAHGFYQQQQAESQQNASQMSDKMYPQSKDSMMSPNRRTPQPSAGPGTVPSPMNVPQAHPGHPSVAHFRGPPSAPASPSVTSRGTPLSPASVRSDAPQPPMRPASGHSEHSNPPAPSPLSGAGTSAYGNYRSHSSQPSYAWQQQQQQSNYPQHMMSPQHQPSYPSNQQPNPAPPAAANLRPSGPPSVGKPTSSSQPFSQSQPSPGFQQSGGHLPYYDNLPQGSHAMQGYSSASPAPSERRPSRQGSQPPVAQTPDLTTRQQGAAAAAAAAMAAAAHTAHPVTLPPPKPQTPNFYPQGQQPRPPHPGYNNLQQQQGMEVNQQNMNYPRMAHPAPGPPAPSPHRVMRPPGMTSAPNQGTYRMPPPSHYPGGYGQPMGPSPQQGQFPGYYPQGPGDPTHPPGPRPGFHPTPNYQQQHTPEETTKKPSARAASQKLAALFEPADEPGRREFIEGLLRYWEEKEVPLKNAPLMGRKTLDLFRLYHIIKERGGMQEVTKTKKWSEICTQLGMGTTSTSGFTLKKQYCKYLYGYECKVDKGVPEPQEALARVTEANRKRKQAQENSKEAQHPSVMQAQPPVMHPHPSIAPGAPPQPFGGQQYPPGQYPPQHYQMPVSHSAPGYMMQGGPVPTSNAYPRPSGPVNTNIPQPGLPAPSYPTVSPNAGPTRAWQHPGQIQAPRQSPVQPPIAPDSGQMVKKGEEIPGNLKPTSQPSQETNLLPANVDPNQGVKPPAPSSVSLSAPNPFVDPGSKQHFFNSASPATSQVYANHDSSQQPYPIPTPQNPHRSAPPNRPGMVALQYPYSNSPMPHQSPLRGPSLANDMRGTPSPGPRTPYQPSPPLTTRPGTSAPHPMAGSSYSGHAPVGNSFPALKRQSNDNYGPPRKFLRPEGPQPYGLNHPSYRPGVDMLRHRFAGSDPSSPGYRPPAPSLGTTGQSRLHSPYSVHRFPRYMSDKSRGHYSIGARSLKHRLQSPLTASLQKYPLDTRPNLKRQLLTRTRSVPQHFQREVALFPPDSVEATHLKLSKFQRKSCQNVGLIEAWRLIMSLKSGLLVESSWALNALSILLYDQRSVAQLRLSHLPGLLDTVVEHYRCCLSGIFYLPSEQIALGLPCDDVINDVAEEEVFGNEEVCVVSKSKQSKKKRRGSAVSKLKRKYTSYKVKVEARSDAFLVDHSHQWDDCKAFDLTDDLSHIILSLSKDALFEKQFPLKGKLEDVGSLKRCIEATLEDILSIPCSVLSPDCYDVTKSSVQNIRVELPENHESETNSEKNETNQDAVSEKDQNSSAKSIDDDLSATERSSNCVAGDVPVEKMDVDDENPSAKSEKENQAPENNPTEQFKSSPESLDTEADTKNSPEKVAPISNNDVSSKNATDIKHPSMCNGLQLNFSLRNEQNCGEKENCVGQSPSQTNDVSKSDDLKSNETKTSGNAASEKAELPEEGSTPLSLTQRVRELLEERNVIILENEAAGSDGRLADALSGPILCSKHSSRRNEIANRLLSTSNVIRNLSFIPNNVNELANQRHLMKTLSGILLLRHKHKIRKRSMATATELEADSSLKTDEDIEKKSETFAHELTNNKILRDNTNNEKLNCSRTTQTKASKPPLPKSRSSELFAPKETLMQQKILFSSTVLKDNDDEDVYKDPWWWDCVQRLREDALIIFTNVASSLDLSLFHDNSIPLVLLEACLHWSICSSSDACDAFSNKPRDLISAQRLSIEILTKLSIKDQNVDLILAMRPYSRLEKLFNFLVCSIGDKRDQVMREFSVVLLSNLSRGDPSAARAVALQGAAISNLISFLEECEEHGHSHRQMFRQPQHEVNCGTTGFMMAKAANTLFAMAVITENKPSFVKHQLRLLSLSMSLFLGSHVTSIISSVLYELTQEST